MMTMVKKGIYEVSFLRERRSIVEEMMKTFGKGSPTYRLAKELDEIYGYLLNDAEKDRR